MTRVYCICDSSSTNTRDCNRYAQCVLLLPRLVTLCLFCSFFLSVMGFLGPWRDVGARFEERHTFFTQFFFVFREINARGTFLPTALAIYLFFGGYGVLVFHREDKHFFFFVIVMISRRDLAVSAAYMTHHGTSGR